VIREAREEDLDAASAMMVAAYREYEPALAGGAWELYEADIAAVRSRLAHSRLLVWDDGGEPRGAITYYPPGGLESMPDGWAYIRLLAVSPAARGRGIGRALVEAAIDRGRADGAQAVAIHTTKWMTSARALYRARGFRREPRFDVEPEMTDAEGWPILIEAYRLDLAGDGAGATAPG
jgi:ribosomal protein S18 acetylase RimI-like enzyme